MTSFVHCNIRRFSTFQNLVLSFSYCPLIHLEKLPNEPIVSLSPSFGVGVGNAGTQTGTLSTHSYHNAICCSEKKQKQQKMVVFKQVKKKKKNKYFKKKRKIKKKKKKTPFTK